MDNFEAKHYLEMEIYQEEKRMNENNSPFYDGVKVGLKEANKLRKHHIDFCKAVLDLLE